MTDIDAPGRRVRVAATADLTDGEACRVDVDGTRIAVVRVGDTFHAVGDRCSHANYSLAEGEVDPDDCTIECWKHGAQFSLTTGEPLTLPATQPVPVFPTSVVADEVFVHLPDKPNQERGRAAGADSGNEPA